MLHKMGGAFTPLLAAKAEVSRESEGSDDEDDTDDTDDSIKEDVRGGEEESDGEGSEGKNLDDQTTESKAALRPKMDEETSSDDSSSTASSEP